jgi:hypothetical protein
VKQGHRTSNKGAVATFIAEIWIKPTASSLKQDDMAAIDRRCGAEHCSDYLYDCMTISLRQM